MVKIDSIMSLLRAKEWPGTAPEHFEFTNLLFVPEFHKPKNMAHAHSLSILSWFVI